MGVKKQLPFFISAHDSSRNRKIFRIIEDYKGNNPVISAIAQMFVDNLYLVAKSYKSLLDFAKSDDCYKTQQFLVKYPEIKSITLKGQRGQIWLIIDYPSDYDREKDFLFLREDFIFDFVRYLDDLVDWPSITNVSKQDLLKDFGVFIEDDLSAYEAPFTIWAELFVD